jgi:hypothetical protein
MSVSEAPALRQVKKGTSETPTYFESHVLYDEECPAPRVDVGLTGSATEPRLQGPMAERRLPHMDMHQLSPLVQSRGTSIRLKKEDPFPVHPYLEPLTGMSASSTRGGSAASAVNPLSPAPALVASASGDAIGVVNALTQSPSNASALVLPAAASGSSSTKSVQSRAAPIRTASPLGFNGSRTNSPMQSKRQRALDAYNTLDRFLDGKKSKKRSGYTPNDSQVSTLQGSASIAPIMPYTKSLRLANAIDVLYAQSPARTVVMTRKDAVRAKEEDTLSRSSLDDLREMAYKRSNQMIEKRSKLKNKV